MNHFKCHDVFHNPKMINEAAASKHVAMVVLKNFLLASNQWMRKKLLHWKNLTSIEQAFLQCICFAALSFSLYRKRYEGLKLQKTTSCSCSKAIHPLNLLTPNDPYMGHTALLTSKHCILYIYSTNIGTEYFKHALYSSVFFSSKCSLFHNVNLFGSRIIHILYTGRAKIKKIIPAPKG